MPSFNWNNPTFLVALAVFGAMLVLLAVLFRFLPDARRKSLTLWVGFLGSILASPALVRLFRMADVPPVSGGSTPREMLDRFHNASPAERMALLAHLPDQARAWHRVGRGDVSFNVIGTGELEHPEFGHTVCQVHSRNPNSSVAGVVKWVIKDGAKVKKGDLLLEIDDSEFKAELRALKSKLAESENAALARLRQLVEADIANCKVRASGDYLVRHYIPKRSMGLPPHELFVGDPVAENQLLFEICDVSKWQIKLRVPKDRLAGLFRGQKVRVHIAVFPNRSFAGEVREIADLPSPERFRGEVGGVYPVWVYLTGPTADLQPGWSAEVALKERGSNVLCVPVTALLRNGSETVCFAKLGAEIHEQPVGTGISDDLFVEIQKGLKEGVEVLRDPRGMALQLAARMPPGK